MDKDDIMNNNSCKAAVNDNVQYMNIINIYVHVYIVCIRKHNKNGEFSPFHF